MIISYNDNHNTTCLYCDNGSPWWYWYFYLQRSEGLQLVFFIVMLIILKSWMINKWCSARTLTPQNYYSLPTLTGNCFISKYVAKKNILLWYDAFAGLQ